MADCKRVLLKISGEAFMGSHPYGLDYQSVRSLATKICELQNNQIEVGVVMGGGNLFRGNQAGSPLHIERTRADQMGMLATLMNGIALKQALDDLNCGASLMSALDCPSVAQRYRWEAAMHDLSEGKILLFAGGTGNPYFTTDTAAALRACEIKADMYLKATTRVDAIYDKDPLKNKNAHRYETITYREVLEQRLGILDLSAVVLCMNHGIPIRVFDLGAGSFLKVLADSTIGSLITQEKKG